MFDAVHGPGRTAGTEGQQTVAAKGAGIHDFGTCFVIVRFLQCNRSILHQGFYQCFTETVGHGIGGMSEILFHHMVDGIGYSCCRVLGIDREGVGRVKERAGREQMRVDISHLVVGLCAGNDSSGIVLTACSGQGKDVHNRQCSQRRSLADNQVPGLAVVFGTSGNGFRTVEYRTATHRKNHVNLLFLADAYAFHYTGRVFRVRLNPTQFKDFKVFQQFFHAVVQADTFDASATVCQQDATSERAHHLWQSSHYIPAKNQTGRGLIVKVLHCLFLFVVLIMDVAKLRKRNHRQ